MSFNRRYFNTSKSAGERAPSDEMLAVDAASEMRSFTLLYERYADRLYRYFLVSTGDRQTAYVLLRNLLERLPGELQRFRPEDRTFSGWLFSLASRRLNLEQSALHRVYRRIFTSERPNSTWNSPDVSREGGDFERVNAALQRISASEREVIAINLAAGLPTLPTSEALRLPASLVSSHVSQAVRSTALELDSSIDPTRLTDQLRTVFSSQTISPDQRDRHLALIHSLFYGEQEVLAEEPVSRSSLARDVSALVGVVLLGLIGLWVYGLVAPGDPSASDSPSAEISIGAQPESTETAGNEASEVCLAMDGKRVFDTFVRRYNQGDFEALRQMLPGEHYEHPLYERNDMEMSPIANEYFRHDDVELTDPDEIIEYLEERYQAEERWAVAEAYPAEHYRAWNGAAPLDIYIDWKAENPQLGMIIIAAMTRHAEDFQAHRALGRATIDCAKGLVIEWNVRPNESLHPEPAEVDEFLQVMDQLQPGEVRDIRAVVTIDRRSDGGALNSWDLRWRQAVWHDGTELERIDVRLLDGGEVISFVDDSSHWRLDQRGWVTYGRSGDVSLPEEIAFPLPWIAAIPDLLKEHENDLDHDASMTVRSTVSLMAGDDTEYWFELDVKEGLVIAARVREATANETHAPPRIQFLKVARSERFDPSEFAVQLQPRFPENDVDEPRFRVPDRQWAELDIIEMVVGNEGEREEYRLRWNEVEFDLTVMPSRGGLDPNSVPEGVDESWATAIANYDYGHLVWAHRHFAGYPTDAIWDNGIYRFEMAVDREAMSPEHNWSLGRLIDLANALSEPPGSDVADRERYEDHDSEIHPASDRL